ncbi:MAG: hypothetical protein IPO67_20290 [Deltaproteobacteria bacterium]|nr:hypothetical protein [Deltaproteobacteria bacterium]
MANPLLPHGLHQKAALLVLVALVALSVVVVVTSRGCRDVQINGNDVKINLST